MIFRAIFISTLFLASLTTVGQGIDSVSLDQKQLTDVDFFKKYSFYDNTTTKQDIRITQWIWSLRQLREVDKSLRQKSVPTFTMIHERPTKSSPYYVIGHYQLPTSDHLSRMSLYRIDTLRKTVDYQSLDDFIKNKWKKIK